MCTKKKHQLHSITKRLFLKLHPESWNMYYLLDAQFYLFWKSAKALFQKRLRIIKCDNRNCDCIIEDRKSLCTFISFLKDHVVCKHSVAGIIFFINSIFIYVTSRREQFFQLSWKCASVMLSFKSSGVVIYTYIVCAFLIFEHYQSPEVCLYPVYTLCEFCSWKCVCHLANFIGKDTSRRLSGASFSLTRPGKDILEGTKAKLHRRVIV